MARVLCVGHAVQDFVFTVAEMPRRAAKHRASAFETVGGGPAATAAVTVARLGGEATLVARVGDDATAGVIAGELEAFGVDCSRLRRVRGRRSSLSSVFVDAQGERLIVNYSDPDMPADGAGVPEPRALGAAAVLADVRWPEGALAALRAARAAGLPGVLDADSPLPPDSALVAAASHVAFSEDGLAEFARETDPHRALERVAREFEGWCCVTRGAEGVWIGSADGAQRVPAPAVRAVDTLGAGDVWHGAFALALAEGRDERAAVRFANVAAALKVQRPGGRRGVPTRTEVETTMATMEAST